MSIDHADSFVDGISIDSVFFASGRKLWLLKGLIVSSGNEYPFQSVYLENPIHENARTVQIQAPECLNLKNGDSITSILTKEASQITLSWKVGDQFLLIRTALTSRH